MSDNWDQWKDKANSQKEKVNTYPKFGQFDFKMGKFFLGSDGPVPYDAGMHPWFMEGVVIKVLPTLSAGDAYRPSFVAFGTYEYIQVTAKSATKLSGKREPFDAFEALIGRWGRIEDVPSGRMKKSKDEFKADGSPVLVPRTAPKFIVLFDDDEACDEAYLIYKADFEGGESDSTQDEVADEREPVLNIVRALKGAGQGNDKIADAIKAFGVTLEDEDVAAVLAE